MGVACGGPAGVVARLAEMVPADERGVLDALAGRLAAGRLRVLVAGEAKRGKSTFVNALVGRDVLPTGVTPLTAVATTVVYGDVEAAEVAFADGSVSAWPLDELDAVVTERGNPGNQRGVAAVTVRLSSSLLARGVELVDTPGTGSVYAHNTAEAERSLASMDAAVFVLTADPPMSASERAMLERVRAASVATFVVLNKIDRLDDGELSEALTFTRELVTESGHGTRHLAPGANGRSSADDPGRDARPVPAGLASAETGPTDVASAVFPMSARRALDGADEGFAEFAAAFAGYLERRRDADLQRSAVRHAREFGLGLLDEVRVTRRAIDARSGAAAGRVAAFRERLDAVSGRRRDAADLAAGEGRRMLAELNEAAGAAGRELSRRVHADVRAYLAELPDDMSAAEVTRRGREHLVARTGAAVEEWREGQRARLEEGLAALDDRLVAELGRELAEVREQARELLDLDLSVPASTERLVADRRFFYSFAENVDQMELLAGAIRRRLPGALGRRVARDHVLAGAHELADRQLGRARADLQARLADSVRALTRAVDARYAAGTGRLTAALDAADRHHRQDATDRRAYDEDLAVRESRLHALLAELTDPASRNAAPAPDAARSPDTGRTSPAPTGAADAIPPVNGPAPMDGSGPPDARMAPGGPRAHDAAVPDGSAPPEGAVTNGTPDGRTPDDGRASGHRTGPLYAPGDGSATGTRAEA